MGSLADTFGGSPARDRAEPEQEGPVLRPGPFAASGEGEIARVTTELTLLGGLLFVAGIGIAFFSSTLLSTLAYVLFVAPGTVLVGRYYLASASDAESPRAVDARVETRTDAFGPVPAVLADLLGRDGHGPGQRGRGQRGRGQRGRGRHRRGPGRSLSGRPRSRLPGGGTLHALLRALRRTLVVYARMSDVRGSRRGERL